MSLGIRAVTRNFLTGTAATFICSFAAAQVAISPALPFTHNENFNSLLFTGTNTWTNGTTLPNWFAAWKDDNNATGSFASYKTSGITGALYSFGQTGASDRALGSINSGTLGTIAFGILFQNQSSQAINSITLNYSCEQWTKQSSNSRGYHRLLISYFVSGAISTSAADMFASGYTQIPEAFGFTPDTTYVTTGLEINGDSTKVNISATFPVNVPPGDQIFIRFCDENENWTDHGMGIDDLSITFSAQQVGMITGEMTLVRPASSDIPMQTVYPYLEQGIIRDIPSTGNYIEPTSADLTNWTPIFNNFYNHLWPAVDAGPFEYSLVHFTDGTTGKEYYLLRKNSGSNYYWGTFVQSVTPANSVLVLQAPHPIDDKMTENQAAAIFQITDASDLMIAGISRCANSTHSSCSGTTNVCNIQNELYRISDVAHNVSSLFHLATTRLSSIHANRIFVQLHGFGSSPPADPYFIASCGTDNGKNKDIPDYGVLIREQILAMNSLWQVKIAHVDDFDRLGGTNNVQGRFLNLYSSDICSGTTKPPLATNRFFHLEQHIQFRRWSSYYDEVATAINNVINSAPYMRQIGIASLPFTYVQDFNGVSSAAGTHTWGNHVHVPGWHAVQSATGLFSNYTTDDGTSASGGLYAYGNSLDRALGMLNDAGTGDIAIGVLFKNNSSDMINRATFSFKGEQWRKAVSGTAQHKLKFSYVVKPKVDVSENGLMNNGLFTNIPAGDLSTVDDNTSSGAMDGNATFSSVTNLTIPLVVAPGDEVFIRFVDENVAGANKALALDDFSVNFDAEPLPVVWKSFSIHQHGEGAILKWITTDERNCANYLIQRSPDGREFTQVGTIDCQNKKGVNAYQFLDENVPLARCYYRLMQLDTDGRSGFSALRFLQKALDDVFSLRLEGDRILIDVSSEQDVERIEAFTLVGQSLASGPVSHQGNNHFELPIKPGTSGLVMVRVRSRAGTYTKKLMIQK